VASERDAGLDVERCALGSLDRSHVIAESNSETNRSSGTFSRIMPGFLLTLSVGAPVLFGGVATPCPILPTR